MRVCPTCKDRGRSIPNLFTPGPGETACQDCMAAEAFGSKPTVDPLPVLRRLLESGCMDSGDPGPDSCFYCGGRLVGRRDFDHAHDCPYVEAITLFGDPNAAKPQGEMRA